MLGHNTLTYLQGYIFIHPPNSNLGTLFYTGLGVKICPARTDNPPIQDDK